MKIGIPDKTNNYDAFNAIITNNSAMLSIFRLIESIAGTSQPVLITGETGVGKELIAKAIHALSGLTGQFVAVNVAGLDDNMFSDTLFGHIKGAFTGAEKSREGLIERASGGTLFLDEIGDLNHASQVKLLRLIQEGEFLPIGTDDHKSTDIRIQASTNKNLWMLERTGKFRKDLNYRLRTHHIHIPPLRERTDDIPMLVDHFINKTAQSLNKKKPTAGNEVYAMLKSYSFPGNIRELESIIFDAVSRLRSNTLTIDIFQSTIGLKQIDDTDNEIRQISKEIITFYNKLPTIKEATGILIDEALKRSNGNQSRAAKILGISQPALSKRLKKE